MRKIITQLITIILIVLLSLLGVNSFSPQTIKTAASLRFGRTSQQQCYFTLYGRKSNKNNDDDSSSSKGFEKKKSSSSKEFNGKSVAKTYGTSIVTPNHDELSSTNAMEEFFRCRDEWRPLFRSILANTPTPPPAMSILQRDDQLLESKNKKSPWKELPQIPTEEEDKIIISKYLDSTQQALIDIPVTEGTEQDANDLHFIEEGRRCLVLNRFQVLSKMSVLDDEEDDNDNWEKKMASEEYRNDYLFTTCWSEIMSLVQDNQEDTGSLIILPQAYSDMESLKIFAQRDILRPLDWLGLGGIFEVATLQRESPSIRLIHKLSNIPEI